MCHITVVIDETTTYTDSKQGAAPAAKDDGKSKSSKKAAK